MVIQFHRFSVPRIEGKIFRKVRCTAKTYNCLERVSRKSMLQLHRSEGCLRTKLCRLDTSSMSRCWSWKHTLFRFFFVRFLAIQFLNKASDALVEGV